MRKIFAVLAALICCLSVWTSVPAAQAFTLDKEDGEYSIQVELEGGSGKASVTSPTLIIREGFIVTPFIMILPFLQASAAIVRVLNMRVAHIHLSIRTSFMLIEC